MWTKILIGGLGLILVGLAGIIYVRKGQLERDTARLVDDLTAAASADSGSSAPARDDAALPAPVRRYLAHVLPESPSRIAVVRIEQSGQFRGGGPDAPWRAFTAVQHVTTRPPGFVWDATIDVLPGVSVRVLDAYHDGRGRLRAVLGGVLPVMEAESGPALDEGELLRYLAEAPLYPTVLRPGGAVDWTPIDDSSARATLVDGRTTASLVFHFNDRDEVDRVHGTRGFLHDDGSVTRRPWIGYWRRYEAREGVRVPTDGEVAWVYPERGEVSYWRGRMEQIEYRKQAERRSAPSPVSASRL